MWAFIDSWFTPSSLFLFLNLMIGTILLTARFGTRGSPAQYHDQQLRPYHSPQLARASSLLDRVKSINFSLYKFDPPSAETEYQRPTEPEYVTEYPNPNPNPTPDESPQLTRTPSLLERLKSINLSSIYRSEEPQPDREDSDQNQVEDQSRDHTHVKRTKSGPSATKKIQAEKMKKSASEKSVLASSGEEDRDDDDEDEAVAAVERRRPATTRVEKKRTIKSGETAPSRVDPDDGVDAKADDFINRFKQQLRLQRLDSLKRFSEILKGK